MRNVTYYSGGLVAGFAITDKTFDKFLIDLEDAAGVIDPYGEDDLSKARGFLDNFMADAQQNEDLEQGPEHILSACYIWNFFNTFPEQARVIVGDIVIVDLDGTMSTVEYVSVNDLNIAQN